MEKVDTLSSDLIHNPLAMLAEENSETGELESLLVSQQEFLRRIYINGSFEDIVGELDSKG